LKGGSEGADGTVAAWKELLGCAAPDLALKASRASYFDSNYEAKRPS
jgi:hypothetical protein